MVVLLLLCHNIYGIGSKINSLGVSDELIFCVSEILCVFVVDQVLFCLVSPVNTFSFFLRDVSVVVDVAYLFV